MKRDDVLSMLNEASAYAAKGWRVFPLHGVTGLGECQCELGAACDSPGKHPAVKWAEEATTDRAQIIKWWGEHPEWGIGIATGEKSDLTVLDVDGPDGAATLNKLQAGTAMPRTPTVKSREDRLHYYFRYTPEVGTKTKTLGAGLDTRSDGGMVVAPPSTHATGSVYQWLVPPEKAELAEWPEFLLGEGKAATGKKRGRPERERFNPANPREVEKVRSALEFVDYDDEEKWGQTGWTMGRAFEQSDAGYAMYSAWAAKSRKYDRKRTWTHYYVTSTKPCANPKLIRHIYEWAEEKGWSWKDGRVLVHVREGDLSTAIDAANGALATAGDIYARDGRLVRAVSVQEIRARGLQLPDAGKESVRRDDNLTVLLPLEVDYLRYRLGQLARFLRANEINCPIELARGVLALGAWPGIQPLRSIARAPFLREDGTICDKVGYDAATSTLLLPSDAILPVPEKPSKKAAQAALAVLRAPFDEMEWRDGKDDDGQPRPSKHEAAFLSFVLTLAARPILPVVPAHIFSAPTPGNGKTLLVDCAALIVHGSMPSKRSYPHEREEARKVLQSVLLAGDPLVLFDNVKEGTLIGGETLSAYITAESVGDRVLGQSSTPRITNSTCFAFSGNNIGAQRELARRALAIELDANVEHPESRKFTIPDLKAHVRENRARLLCAALTVLRAFVIAGAPEPGREPIGSFEAWDRLVIGTLVWLGLPDPTTTQADLHADDMETVSAALLFKELARVPLDKPYFTVADVRLALLSGGRDDLVEAINGACPGGVKELGYWLRAHKNQVHDGRKLIASGGTTDGGKRWEIKDQLTPNQREASTRE